MTLSRGRCALIVSLLSASFSLTPAMADQALWNQVTGNWNVPANWSTGIVPGLEFLPPFVAVINNSGAATINTAVPTVNGVWVGNNAGKGTLNVTTGGALTATAADQTGIIVVGRTVDQLGDHTGSRLNVTGGTILTDGMEVGQDFEGSVSTDAQVIISGNGAVTVKNFLRVGHGGSPATGGGVGILTIQDNGTFTNDGTGTLPFINDFIAFGFNGGENGNPGGIGGNTGTLNLRGNAIFSSKRPVRFGWVEEGHGFLNISDSAQLIIDSGEVSPAAIMFGDFNNSVVGSGNNRPIGIAMQTGGTVTVGTDVARPQWTAVGGSGYGEYHISGGKLNIFVRDGLNVGDTDQEGHPGEGRFELTGGTVNATEVTVGKIGLAIGVFTQSGGTLNVGIVTSDGNFVDRIDTLPVSDMRHQAALNPNYDGRLVVGGGLLPNAADPVFGLYTLSAGTLHARGLNIGNLGPGTFTQSGGTVTADVGAIVGFGSDDLGRQSVGTVNLNGGVFQTAAITGGGGAAPGVSTVNFNGGTVRALANQPNFIATLTSANVQAGGLVVDSNGFNIGSNQAFSGAGGLTKVGAGTLTLSASNTYAGATNVQAGTLLVNGSHTGAGVYTVAAGATLGGSGTIGGVLQVSGALAPGTSIGTLTVNGNVNLGTSGIFAVEINAATHTADKLVVNGNLNLSGLGDMLRLSLVGGALPEAGPLTIATYTGTLTGTFNLDNADLVIDYGSLSNSSITISNITSISNLLGDYNEDGKVNAADYTVYRNRKSNIGGSTLPNDASPPAVTFEDYTYWKNHYGEPGAGLGSGLVPEPATLLPLVCGLLIAECSAGVLTGRRRRHARRTGFDT